MRMWVSAAVFLVVVSLAVPGRSEEIQEKKKELTTIKKEIEEKRRKIKEASKEERSIVSEMSEMDKKLAGKEKELVSISRDIEAAEVGIQSTEERIKEVKGSITTKQGDIEKRLVALYKLGRAGYLPVLFAAKSREDMKRRGKYLSAVIYSDRVLFASFTADLDNLESAMRDLQGKKNNLSLLKENADKKALDLVREKERRAAYLADIRQEKSSYKQALVELEAAEKNLASLIERLQIEKEKQEREAREKEKKIPANGHTSAPSGGYFLGLKGKLPYPTSGTIITKYGKGKDPKYDNPIYNKGIEIKAPEGNPIITVADGEVVYADYFPGYGNLMIIDHGDGYYTVYAHAKGLLKKVGEKVKAGEKIGTVGDTGSLKGPTLYFEIRHHGSTNDPQLWLAAS